MWTRIMRRHARSFAVAPVIFAALACGDSVGPIDEPEVQIASARLAVGNQPGWTELANGGNSTVELFTSTTMIAVGWLDATGRIILGTAAANLELRITGADFTPVPGTFSGRITGLEQESTVLQVVAWHKKKARAEFEGTLEIVRTEPEPYECDPWFDPWCY